MNATLIIGVVLGIGVGMFLFSLIVPNPSKFTSAYHMGGYQGFNRERGEVITVRSADGASMMIQGRASPTMMGNNFRGNVTFAATRAVPSTLLNETQFLNEIIAQYEATVRLAHQALSVEGMSTEVTSLAQNIIDTQTAEVSVFKDLLTPKVVTKTTVKVKK